MPSAAEAVQQNQYGGGQRRRVPNLGGESHLLFVCSNASTSNSQRPFGIFFFKKMHLCLVMVEGYALGLFLQFYFFSVCNYKKLENFAFAGYDPSNPGSGYGQQGAYGVNNMNNNNPYGGGGGGGYGGGYGQGGVGGYQVRKEKNLKFIIDYFTMCFCYF